MTNNINIIFSSGFESGIEKLRLEQQIIENSIN